MVTPNRASRRRGHSLVELLLSASVLVIAVVGAFSTQLAGKRLMQESRDTALATSILCSNLEALLARPKTDFTSGVGGLAPGAPVEPLAGHALQDQTLILETPGWAPGDPVPDVLDISLRLNWTASSGRARTMREVGSLR
mgnify:CR=1 FL=1